MPSTAFAKIIVLNIGYIKAKQVTHHNFVAYKTEDKKEIDIKNLRVFEYVKDLI